MRGVRKHVQAYLKDFLFDPGLVDTKVGIHVGRRTFGGMLLAREVRPAPPTCWCWMNRPMISISKRSICCRK